MADRTFNVLFLCTGNSARSILAEALLNGIGMGRFRGYSAGSHPTGKVNPLAVDVLRQSRLPADGLRSKAWDEFAVPGAPKLDFVFTVCDNAAGEVCPVWPGQPISAHWGVEDPAAVDGTEEEKRRAFTTAFNQLRNRIDMFVSLPLERLDQLALKKKLDEIGKAFASPPTVRKAASPDWDAIRSLLLASELPLDGAQAHLDDFLVMEDPEGLIACGGLERYGSAALLRSVAVAKARRGRRLGRLLVDELCAQARSAHVETLVLLTDSAEPYFRRLGFKTVSRNALPDAVKASAEFQGACPDSATAMVMALAPSTS